MDTPPCRYTRLPKLQFGEEIPESASVDFALQDPSCSDKDVVSAWCSLLSALTGDEGPVFYLDENVVRFNPATGAVENVELVHEECDDTRLYAALSIRGAKTKHCDEFGLSLRYDVLNQTGTLAARGFSTTAYLQEIDSQLRSFLRQQSKPCQLSVQNAKPSLISGPTLLHELFTSHCDSHHTALDFLQKGGSRTELSYNQLHRLSNNLALKINSTLEQHGSDGRSRIIIPVMLPQSPEFYISWLAVLKSGAAICPLNLDTPPERIKFILNDVCATAVITAPHLADRIREARNDVAIIFAPDQNEDLNHLLDTLENSRIHTSDPAYIMYTSGSTGLPKGVLLSHQAATQALLAHDRHIPPFSRFLQFASPTFDVSVFEIFFPWFRGATLVGCERGKMLSNLPEIMNIMQVDAAEFTPTVANELVRSRSNVPSLKVMLTIGEMLTRHVIDEFGASREREGLLCGMYGPTEAAIHCTVAERIHVGDLVGNIGVPLHTVSIFIVPIVDRYARNQGFNISPLGHIGELALGGYQLADGYLNREKENKTAFIDLPGYGRVYRTGDKARIHPNGLLECLGRITTDQVKLRGQRIELGEIEQIICKVEGVRNAVVNVVEGILVAFVTLDGRSVSSADISATCKRWLPRYMIPGDFVILDELPRLPSAKIDRKLLVAEYQNNRKPAKAEFSDRSDKLTRNLVLHVEEILGVPVGVDESLASKGLDSLGAIKLASTLRGEGMIFDVTDILDADCIRTLSLRVQLKENVAHQSNLISQDEDFRQVKAVVVEELNKIGVSPHVHDIYPCSPIQIAMLTETVRDHQAYFNLIEHEFEAGVQEDEVRNAIMMVAQQNEILRTGFLSTENSAYSFVQIIWDDLKEEQFSGLHTYDDDLQSRMLRPLSFKLMHIDAKIRMRCQIHHSLYDGWSWELVCNDINRVLAGKKLPRRPQYRAVVDTLNHGIQSETWERATDYWRDQLRGYQGRRWPNFNYKSSVAPGRQTLHRTMKIQAPEAKVFARNLHVSIQAIFQSALAYLLASYLGSDDVVIGSVSSGRTLGVPGVEKIIGPCVATVPLRFRTRTVRTLRDLLITANTLNRQNLRHEFVSLQQIQKLSELSAHEKLFHALFVWQDMLSDQEQEQREVIRITRTEDYLEFALLLEMQVMNDSIQASVTFDTSAMSIDQADLLLRQLDCISSIIIADPVSSLEAVSNKLPRDILSVANFPHTETPSSDLTHGVQNTAKANPDRIAVEFGEDVDVETGDIQTQTLTYSELEILSNALAHYLLSLHVKPGDFVAVYMEKCLELYISILAVVKAGAAFVPIAPSAPKSRVLHTIDECASRIILTTSNMSAFFGFPSSVVTIDVDKISLKGLSSSSPPHSAGTLMPAYAIFTSGSTGIPKGVIVTRGNLQSNLSSLSKRYPTEPDSKLLQSCSQAFDVAIFEIFFTLNKGMTLCATTNDLLFRDIEHFIQRMGVTHLSMTSTVAALVQPENVPKVRFLVSAGESLNSKVLAKWGGKGLWQGYGPTETTNIVTLKENIESGDRPNDIGTPLETTSVFIAAEGADFSLVPRGGIGELCFGGDQVAQGYANMEALTQEKFITHPEFGRIYRSGDFGRMLPNSSILFLGRKDDQVKFRGQRIELGEIDACLSQQPEISDSMTMIQLCQEENQQRLVSFLVLSDRLKQNTLQQYQIVRNLFNALETSLPPYMIPSAMIPVESFPLNASGKKDPGPLLEQLKNFDHETFGKFSHGASISEDAEDLSEAENVIASCISQVTNIPLRNIRKHSSFFALGLDSISATSLSKSLRSRGLGQIDVSKILTYSSVFRLAAYISEHRQSLNPNGASAQESSLLPSDLVNQVWQQTRLRGYEPTDIFPCTPLQETMLAQLSDGDSYHNVLTLEPICDLEVLKSSWEKAIERHDILRTRFASTYDTRYPFVQIVLRKIELTWTVVSEGDNVEASLNGMHDLKADDLVPYKFTVYRSGPQPLLKIDIHHSIYDAAAMSIILHDVEAIIQGHTRPPTLQFEGFLRYMVASETTECYSFWQNYLNGVRCMKLVSRTPITAPRYFETVRGVAPMSLSDLTGQCMEMSTTLLSVIQATWAKVLSHFSNTQELCFGNVYSGRNIPVDGADLIVGPCFNTLPIRVTLSPKSINLNIIHGLRDDNLRILPYQLTPLRKLRTQLRRDNGALFDTLLLLQDDKWRLDDTIWKLKDEHGAMDLPLICEVIPDKETGIVETVLHFDGSLISKADADSILSAFKALLSHTVLYPYSQALDTTFLDNLVLQSVEFEVQKADAINESYMHEPSVADWDAHAAKIRDVLCELSGAQRADITLDTTIYQLGLDSINALQLARKLTNLGYEITAGDILEKPSVYEIAEHIVSTHDKLEEEPDTFDFSAFAASQKGLLRKNPYAAQHLIKSVLPCTHVQAGMLASFINSDGASYFNHLLLRLDSIIDMAMVRNAWELLIERHEMLRTGFFQTNSRDTPFAMVTYATEALASHWKSVDCLHRSSQEVSLLRKRMCEEALENLVRPPWFISLQDDEPGVLMQFSAHHALYDAQSLSLILSDFSKLLRGNALVEPPSVWPMHEIIINEAHTCSTVAREYWQSMQSKFLVTKFPDVNPFHPNQPYYTSSLAFESQQSLPRLQELCNNANVSLQGACQAAWARLLSAYVGETTVTYGIVLSGRSIHAEAEDITFPCLVTLPAFYQVEGTNRQMLNRVMAQNSQLTRYQFTPLSKIYEWTKFDSSLFNTLFVFQKFQQDTQADLPWVILDEKAEVDYPISLEISPSRTALHYNLSFRSDLLPQAQAELMLWQLDQLLLHCLSSLEDDVNDISVFSPDIISVTPAKEIEIAPPCRLLHQLFEKTASRSPSKVALECITRENSGTKARQWTYAEVDKEANRYAHLFQQHGASPGGLIAICFDKCPAAYMAILGILKAGCAYVAIDPTAPVARKRFILEDSGAQMLLGISDTAKDLKLFATSDVIIVDEPGILQNFPESSPSLASAISPDNASYCLYTSGTTGTPKGCQITHNNAVQAMLAFQRLFSGHWDETSRWLQFASFHFDVSVLEQYWTWSVGICLVSCPRDLLFEDLPGTLAKLEITHIDLTPSLARLVHPDEVPSLKKGVFITGGEALRQDILDDWGRFNVIYNGYGPTEVTIGCTMFPRVPENGKPANIGPQFDNVSSYVFRPGTTTPVLRGGIGELCVGGPLVGKGYLNRDDLTKERFICLDKYDDRIYRTGDLVRLYHDGTFCFLGRQDDQIKLRGQRLEIGEINETITQSAKEIRGVATIVAKRSEKTRDQLVSFLVISEPVNSHAVQDDLSPRAQEIVSIARQACLAALPGYMVPTHIIPLNRMPLSANNKLDAKQLKSIYSSLTPEDLQRLSRNSSDKSTTVTEALKKFIVLVSDLLGLDSTTVSPGSNIFQLGLDSITVTVFTKDLRNNGFRSVSSADVMKNPTIASLYKVISETDRQDKSNRSLLREAKLQLTAFSQANFLAVTRCLNVNSTDLQRIGRCTPLQEGILYQYLESQGKSYLANFCFEVSRNVSISRLQQSWTRAQESIPALRTRFVSTDNGFVQAITKEDILPCSHVKVSHDEASVELIQRRFHRWVDEGNHLLSPWEVLFVEDADKTMMVINIFHAIYDGISLPFILREVAKIYMGPDYTPDKPSLLDALPWVFALDASAAREFWMRHITERKARLLASSDFENAGQPIVVTHELKEINNLETLRRELNVTEQAIFLACWVYITTQHFHFCPKLGLVVSGRAIDFDRAQDVIGPMFNTIPCAVSPAGCALMRDLVKLCHDYYASIIPYQHTPLRDIRKWLKEPAESPLFDSLFVFQKDSNEETSTEELWHAVSSDSDQDFSLSFEVQRQNDGQVTLTLATKDGIMSQDDAKNLCTLFDDTLHAFMQNLDMPLDIELPDEKQTTETDEPHDLSQPSGQAESFEWTPLALQLREQIAQLAETDVSSIQANTSIFEFGLDSIDAIRLSSRMKSSGVKLPVTTIMKGRTIANLVKSVSSQVVEDNYPEFSINDLKNQLAQSLAMEVSELHDVEDVLPATPLQEAMVAEMASSDFHRYFNHDVMELASWVDLDRLKCAWQDVIHKNPILRTRFVEVSDPNLPFSYTQVVCSGDDKVWETREIDEGEIDDYLRDPTHWYKPADVLNSKLVHLQLVTAADRRYLVFSASHALYDGWSLNLIHQDVKSAYYNSAPKRPACEAALERVINSSGETAAEFWKGALVGYTPVKFPKQVHGGGQNTVHRGEKVISISATQMSSFCKNERISPQALGLACWSLVYAGYIQKLDVVFGTVMLGRDSEDAEQMMFPMFNTVAFRTILHGSRKELLKYTQERLDAVREYQHYPLRKAKAFAQGISGDLALFDTLFIYQRNPDRGVVDEGVEQSLYKSVGGESDLEVPVCAEVEVVGDDIIWRVSARDTVLGDEDVTGLFERIGAVFEEVVNKPMEEVISEVEGGISVCGCPAFREFDEDDGSENDGQTRFLMDLENWKPTALERKIMDALASVAGIPADDISPEQSLFHLGLDSISAIKVSSLLRKQSVFLAVSEMVKAGTVPEMAKVAKEWKALENKRKTHDVPKLSEEQTELLRDYGMNAENIEYVLPATAGQIYMLATHEASNGRLFYPYFVYKLARTAGGEQLSGLEVRKRLNTAWTTLTKRLPILRTVFVPTGKGKDNSYKIESLYLQAILRDVDNSVRWEDQDELKKLANTHGRDAKYNAGEIPVTLHALHPSQGDEEDVGDDVTLILHIHHALYDAVSLPLMMDTLADLFFSTKMEGGNETMDPATDLKDFVQYLQEHSPVERRKAFWKEYLDSSIARENKHLKPRAAAAGAARSGRVEAYRESLLANTSAAIEQARRHGVSVQAIFLACFARVWKRILFMADGQDRETIVVGVYLSNRGHALDGLSQMIGPSLNIVPLKVDVSDDEEREVDIARRVQGDLQRVSTVENSCVSLEEVREWTGVRVDVFVNFLRGMEGGEREEGQGQGQGKEGRVRYMPAEALEQAGDDDYDESIGKSEMTYSVGIDIEAAIREKRRLDMGIFAERRKMSDEEAEMVFNEVRKQMKMIRE